jgi:hypothetical protein
MAISNNEARRMYEEAFGPVKSMEYVYSVINSLQDHFVRLFPGEPLPDNLATIHTMVNQRLHQEMGTPTHTQGYLRCSKCYDDMYSYCTVCVGPHSHNIPGLARQMGIAEGLCDSCMARRRRLGTKALAVHRFKTGALEPSIGSMVWAEHMGDFYAAGAKKKVRMPQKFRTAAACMEAQYQDSEGSIKQFTKDQLYFMGKGMGLPVTRQMTKQELCNLISR